MPATKQTEFLSEKEYLDGEMVSDIKHEYVDGEVYAMAGASKNHERIAGNLFGEFRTHLKNSPCEPFGSDLRLRTPTGNYRYPDCMVVCEDDGLDDYYTQSPVIVVEVISRSTRKTDEQIKRLEYINIATLKEYVVIEQDFVDVTVYRRSDDWRSTHYFLGDDITFESIDLTLPVAEIYHRVVNLDMEEWLQSLQQQD
jgi:Uma2 family endonuclease